MTELLSAKLAFVLSIAGEMEPFLAEFQTNKPMTPFLSTALDGILRSLLARIVKKEVLDAADAPSKLLKVDFERTDNFVESAAFDVGFATKIELRKKPQGSAADHAYLQEGLYVICEGMFTEDH